MVRCAECKKTIVENLKGNSWLKLVYFIQFLYSEGYIEQATYEDLQDDLQVFKSFAFDWDKPEKEPGEK